MEKELYPESSHALFTKPHFPKELSMLSIGEALVKATEMSQTRTSSIKKTNFQEFHSSQPSKQS